MTVTELIEKLKTFDGNKDVYVPNNDGEYEYYIAHSVRQKKLTVLDESEDCIVIDFE
jgi:hypothetical protein